MLAGGIWADPGGKGKGKGKGKVPESREERPERIPACGSGPELTQSPLAMGDFLGLVPLGNLNPTGHVFPTDHMYFYIRRSGSDPATVPVVAPSDGWITQVAASEHVGAGFTDYQIAISPCREFKYYFGHVSNIPPKLLHRIGDFAAADCHSYSTGGETFNYCRKEVRVRIRAGQRLGTAGRPGQNALDMGAFDFRVPALPYANTARVCPSGVPAGACEALQVVCPVDYFSSGVADALEARLGTWDGSLLRTVDPLCGEVEQDEPDKAQGKWYVSGTTEMYPEDPHLALVHDNVEPEKGAFSVGNSLAPGLSSGVYFFTPTHSGLVNRDFDEVLSDGDIYCYDSFSLRYGGPAPAMSVIIQMTSDTTLQIEKQSAATCGSGPWSFTSAAREFER